MPQSASLRIHEALLSIGVDSYIYALGESFGNKRILYGKKYSLWEKAYRKSKFFSYRMFEHVLKRFFKVQRSVPISLGIGSMLDRKFLLDFNPDIVNLHWVCGNFISSDDIVWLSRNFKVVWTLHDSWALTGGCHVPQSCVKWQKECKNCPIIGKRFGIDLARLIFRRKRKKYAKAYFKVIGVSNWMSECAEKSSILGKKNIFIGHNTLNQEVFKPHGKSHMRKILGLPHEKRLILFGAMNSTSDFNKGFNLLYDAIRQVTEKQMIDNFELMVFGSDEPKNPPDFGAKVHYMGRFKDNLSLSILYGAADVMVVPSRSESFSNTVQESLSCGTPVVAFRIGGIPDQIDHLQNGYLAEPYDSADLAKGIAYILEDEDRRINMGCIARKKIERLFSWQKIAEDYIRIYNE